MQLEAQLRPYLMARAYAKSSVATYESQLKAYLRFAASFPADWLWTDALGVLWLRHCIDDLSYKKSTLRGKIAAFKYGVMKHTGRTVDSDSRGSLFFFLSREITRLPDEVERKRPVLLEELQQIWLWMNRGNITLLWFSNMVRWLVSYACMLRSAEAAAITWDGVTFTESNGSLPAAMTLSLLVSDQQVYKTHSNAVTFHMKARPERNGFCVVHMMWTWR